MLNYLSTGTTLLFTVGLDDDAKDFEVSSACVYYFSVSLFLSET
jgi:hypothetical protein